MPKKRLIVDVRNGGLGDIWMRLVSLYCVAGLRLELKIGVIVPDKLFKFASFVLGDRLEVGQSDVSGSIAFTSRGIRHLFLPAILGRRFALPYARAVIRDRKDKSLKRAINSALLSIFDSIGWLQVPPLSITNEYQGYLEVVSLKSFRNLHAKDFYAQLTTDFPVISSKLQSENLPRTSSLEIPDDLKDKTIVFPTGTGRQFMPAWWAKRHLPSAYFAFFDGDKDRKEYAELDLNTVSFFREPGDIIYLALHAARSIATDSFCSHLLQYTSSPKVTVLMTELARSRVIVPEFKGNVIESLAPCYPCLHLARGSSALCQAGFKECLNWTNPIYSENASRVH